MFERMGSINANPKQQNRVAVRLTLDDGTSMAGEFVISGHADLQSYLNGDRQFFLFEKSEGGLCYLSKTSIRRIDPVTAPKAGHLDRAVRDTDRFDPFSILGVERDADSEAIRTAYRARVKAYHPDRIAGLHLPSEMVEYSAAMLSRINAAYDQLSGPVAH